MATAAGERTELTAGEWAAAFAAGVAGVQARGKAEPGDKTMVDALAAGGRGARGGRRGRTSLARRAAACGRGRRAGHEATVPLVARKGRASYLGERSAGHQDPGATSSGCWLDGSSRVGERREARRRTRRPGRERQRRDASRGRPRSWSATARSSPRAWPSWPRRWAARACASRVAGGLDQPGSPLGTDAMRVVRAIEEVWSPDGVLVLMDLGSAVLSAEMALDLLPRGARASACCSRPRRSSRAPSPPRSPPASATPSRRWPREARGALAAKAAQLAGRRRAGEHRRRSGSARRPRRPGGRQDAASPDRRCRSCGSSITNRWGCTRGRPPLLVRTAAGFDADVTVADVDRRSRAGRAPAASTPWPRWACVAATRSLGCGPPGRRPHEALDALRRLADDGFGDLGRGADAPPALPAAPGRRPERPARRACPQSARPPSAAGRLPRAPCCAGCRPRRGSPSARRGRCERVSASGARRRLPQEPRGRLGRPASGALAATATTSAGRAARWPGGRATTTRRSSTPTCCSSTTRRCSVRREPRIFERASNAARAWADAVRGGRGPGRRWTTRICARGRPTCAASATRCCVICSRRGERACRRSTRARAPGDASGQASSSPPT